MTKKYFSEGLETPNALKMYLDHITNIEIIPLPSPEYDTETRDMYGHVIPSDEELDVMIDDVLDDEDIMESSIKEHDEVDMGDYTYDSSESEIEFTLGEFEVEGNYNKQYEDLFYHITIKKNGKTVYQNDYGKEKHDNNEITDEQVDEILDLLITYAVEADPTINENFEVMREAYVSPETKTKIVTKLKTIIPKDWKYSVSTPDKTQVKVTIQSAPIPLKDIVDERYKAKSFYMQLNHFYPERVFKGKTLKTIENILTAMNTDNYDNSNSQIDYFDVGHYVRIHFGKWDKNFVNTSTEINEDFEVMNEASDTFTDAMLDKLRKEYSKLNSINPDGPAYNKMTKYLDSLPDAAIKQLATAKVKFLSSLALNRAIRRGIKLNEATGKSNLDLIQNMKGKEITLKFKNGDEMDIDSADARILTDFYKKLPDAQKAKFAELLDKSQSSFLIAYNQSMK